MTEPKLQELLDRLKKLDPETWNCYQHRLAPLRDTPCDMRSAKIIICAILQGVIQDAIAARAGWACIHLAPEYKFTDVCLGEGRSWREEADTAAEALLAAYIQALEAEAAK